VNDPWKEDSETQMKFLPEDFYLQLMPVKITGIKQKFPIYPAAESLYFRHPSALSTIQQALRILLLNYFIYILFLRKEKPDENCLQPK
jgi:hypothetical protein